MKKLVSLLLIACMACMLIPAVAEGVTGTWYMVELETNGTKVNPAAMGVNWTMVLNGDGTAENKLDSMGDVQEASGTWTADGDTVTVTIDKWPPSGVPAGAPVTDPHGETMLPPAWYTNVAVTCGSM